MNQGKKPPLLFLCHRIPYPPNKGDKIRAFHLLRHLSSEFDVILATFVDDPRDWPHTAAVDAYCRETFYRELIPWRARLRSLKGLLRGEALTLPYYRDPVLKQWVEAAVEAHGIRHAIVYSACMAQFVPDPGHKMQRKVIDFVDVDSDKWAQYAERKRWPMNWIYRREARCLLRCEQELAVRFDAGLFVSPAEADMFHELSPQTAGRIGFYNNGVDSAYFAPDTGLENPYPEESQALVFTGAMDYWPNVDAVCWFAEAVFPALRHNHPNLHFYIVGGNPAREVQRLAEREGVVVTGRVDDVRPYLQYCAAAVAPMRVARGVQNKVLEAMAMARPVLVTEKGLEGIHAVRGSHVLVADSPDDYQREVVEVLAGAYAEMGARARDYVLKDYNWDDNLPEVSYLLGEDDAVPRYARDHAGSVTGSKNHG